MAAAADGSYVEHTHFPGEDHGHGTDGAGGHVCDENCGPDCAHGHDTDEAGGSGSSGGSSAGSAADYSALLYYTHYSQARWNAATEVGTQTIVSYSFTDTADLPSTGSYNPYNASAYWSYSDAQRAQFRDVISKFEEVSGLRFVEVEGDSMINVFGANVSGVGGWANIPSASNYGTSEGKLVNAYSNMNEGAYGYQVNLHELGHAVGLQHPHEGPITLDASVDTQANTVMTYNVRSPYATELGIFDVQALQDIYGTSDQFADWDISVGVGDIVTIRTAAQAEVVLGTDQNDLIFGFGGDDEIIGGEGDDRIQSGNGNDTVFGSDGNDNLFGGNGDDVIIGGVNSSASSGNSSEVDRLFGNNGDDELFGGNGGDILNGGLDDDLLEGGAGDDRLFGGSGDDTLRGGDGTDRLLGGAGNDVFVFDNADANEQDYIYGFEFGSDIIDLSAFGYMNFDSLNIVGTDKHTHIQYGNWLEITLANRDASDLSADDFAFV